MEGRSSTAPWLTDRSAWGRIRLTRRMWAVLYPHMQVLLKAKWAYHHDLPNPSPESRKNLDEIREIQKVIHNLEGLAEEKGWDIPDSPTGT